MNILKIVIQDVGHYDRSGEGQPPKWVTEPKIREYTAIDKIDHQFDKEHVWWMVDNKQWTSTLGQRVYQLIEEVR